MNNNSSVITTYSETANDSTNQIDIEPSSFHIQNELIIDTSSNSSNENHLILSDSVSDTKKYLDVLQQNKRYFKMCFLHLVDNSIFEYGFSSQAEEYLERALSVLGALAREWINEIYLENIEKEKVLVGLLRVISHLKYDIIYPVGVTIATAALVHKSSLVKENGIRAFENWEEKESIIILENIVLKDSLISKYLSDVINDLKEL